MLSSTLLLGGAILVITQSIEARPQNASTVRTSPSSVANSSTGITLQSTLNGSVNITPSDMYEQLATTEQEALLAIEKLAALQENVDAAGNADLAADLKAAQDALIIEKAALAESKQLVQELAAKEAAANETTATFAPVPTATQAPQPSTLADQPCALLKPDKDQIVASQTTFTLQALAKADKPKRAALISSATAVYQKLKTDILQARQTLNNVGQGTCVNPLETSAPCYLRFSLESTNKALVALQQLAADNQARKTGFLSIFQLGNGLVDRTFYDVKGAGDYIIFALERFGTCDRYGFCCPNGF